MDVGKIDIDRLRDDLEDYFGTAMFSGFGAAMIDLEDVKNASSQELIRIARNNGFNLNDYIENDMDYER